MFGAFRLYAYAGIAVAIMAAFTTVYFKGRSDGAGAERARQAKVTREIENDLADVAAILRVSEQQRLQAERTADLLQEELDNESRNDPDANRIAVSAAGVRRINQSR